MNFKSIMLLAALLPLWHASAGSVNYRIAFPQSHYDVPGLQEFQIPIRINPLPAAGLFSYGLITTVEGDNGLVGIVTMNPLADLAFDGVLGAGSRGVAAETGKFSSKGSVNVFLPDKANHLDPVLGNLSVAGLPDGNYTLRLAPYNTLGPTETIFVDGLNRSLDPQLEFGSATVAVISAPTGTITEVGAIRADRQTGLLIQQYDVKNTGRISAVFRVLIKNMPAGSTVWNAHGQAGGVPYIDLPALLAPGATTRITIEYRSQDRSTIPKPQFELIAAPASGFNPQGVATTLKPRATISGGDVLLEFDSETGISYYIQYSSDLIAWQTALPKVEGTGNRIQWVDNGSPKTASHPSTAGSRFYRILPVKPARQ
jgi:hypothetical protein